MHPQALSDPNNFLSPSINYDNGNPIIKRMSCQGYLNCYNILEEKSLADNNIK